MKFRFDCITTYERELSGSVKKSQKYNLFKWNRGHFKPAKLQMKKARDHHSSLYIYVFSEMGFVVMRCVYALWSGYKKGNYVRRERHGTRSSINTHNLQFFLLYSVSIFHHSMKTNWKLKWFASLFSIFVINDDLFIETNKHMWPLSLFRSFIYIEQYLNMNGRSMI